MYLDYSAKLKDNLQAAAGVSLTANFWTSGQNRAYIGVTVHYTDTKEWLLKKTPVF